MKKFIVALLVMSLGTVGLSVAGSPAFAAPPANDAYADRASLSLGDEVAIDTTEATAEVVDMEATDTCVIGAPPATANTVWFDWVATPPLPPQIGVVVDNATFPAGVAVVTGDPGSFDGVACGPGLAVFIPVEGTTYHVVVFDFLDAGGGPAVLTLDAAPPPPALALTVDPTGRFDPKSGGATLSGTYTCTDALFVDLFGEVRQAVGRFVVRGSFFTGGVDCDGEPHVWAADVVPGGGKFAGGQVVVVTVGFACGVQFCADTQVEQTVRLNGGRS